MMIATIGKTGTPCGVGIALMVVTLLLAGQPLYGQPTDAISFQGRLADADGQPVADGSYSVRFQLFDAPTGGAALWDETHTVETTDGIFSTLLGTETPFDVDAFDTALYLALTLDGEELQPRTPLSTVPYAMQAQRLADGALVAGSNVTIQRQGNGAFEIAATGGGGGLAQVASDATLTGEGTTGSPLAVQVPLVLTNPGTGTVVEAHNGTGTTGHLGGSDAGAYGEHSQGHRGLLGSEYSGVFGLHSNGNTGDLGNSNYGAYGFSNTEAGVYGGHNSGHYGLLGSGDYGVYGEHNNGNTGHLGSNGYGAYGKHESSGNFGILGGASIGVWGVAEHPDDWAGFFTGTVVVTGTLSKGGGSFKIDHPLDPANKYLAHSFVESPDMMNVYNGNAVLDAHGEAVVELPEYFEALNRDFRYQLTAIGAPGPNLYIAEKINSNRFRIAGGTPGMEVSWQVTGIRQDAWANEHRIVVEEDKPLEARGYYLHPTLFGQPAERSIESARHLDVMREIQEKPARLEAEH